MSKITFHLVQKVFLSFRFSVYISSSYQFQHTTVFRRNRVHQVDKRKVAEVFSDFLCHNVKSLNKFPPANIGKIFSI